MQVVTVAGFCVMPNHWHLVLVALEDGGVSRFMKWITETHARRYRDFYNTTGNGHVYQDRFKSTLIEDEAAFLRVMRYVETNALRANLCRLAEAWPWGSAYERLYGDRRILGALPYELPENWCRLLVEYAAMRDGIDNRD